MKGVDTLIPDTASRSSSNLTQQFRVYFNSEKGIRPRNEDNFLIIDPSGKQAKAHWLAEEKITSTRLSSWPSGYARLAVADGMGGHAGGKEIAQAAVEGLLAISSPAQSIAEMNELINTLHSRLYEQFSTEDEQSPGTTLLVVDLCLASGKGILGHVGDSRAYKLEPGKAKQLTKDHTFEEFDYREGDIDRQEYKEGLDNKVNEVVQALGHGSFGLIRDEDGYRPNRFNQRIRLDLRENLRGDLATHTDIMEIRLSKGKAVLLATDGLWNPSKKGCWHGLLTNEILSSSEVKKQISKALQDGSRDNVTAVLFGYCNEE